ncbi:MAG: TolC family outer membrane protein [Sulfurimonas sp.]|nr:TolC family outer membrane protein [Sulfurimonas sp.]
MKNKLLASAILLPVLASAVSITDAVQQTIGTHPQMKMKIEDHNTQKELLTSVKSGYLPSIDLSYSIGPEKTRTIANGRQDETLTRSEFSIKLSQNVFSGFDTRYGVKQQKSLVLSAGSTVQEGANNLALEAVSAYINVLKTHEFLEISKENVAVHKKYLSQIKEKVDAGVGRSSDYKQTLSRYENALSNQYLSQQNYDNAITSYKRILPGNVTASDLDKPSIGSLPAQNIEALFELAIKNNPTIHVSQNEIGAADAALKRSEAPFYPTANIVLESSWDRQANGVSTNADSPNQSLFDKNDARSALLVLNYNIFNGLADKANKEASRYRLLNKNSTLADAKRFVKANTQIAWQTFNSTKQQLVHIDNNIESTSQTVSDYLKENELGRRSIVDLLNIELEYNNARNSKVTAEYDNIAAYYQLLSYTGKILEEMNIIVK